MNTLENDDIFSPLLLKKRCHSCGVKYYDEFYLTKKQLEELFEIDEKVIDWYVEDNLDELKENGYKVLDSEEIESIKNLNNIDLDISNNYIELFSFQTILNISMLMFHGHNTSIVRQNIIKIVMQSLSDIDILKINANIYDKKNGAKNENISSFLENKTYNDSNIKRYIFKSIFQKKADDYYRILHIQYQDSIRSIMNLEITDLIDKYFNILFHDVKELSQKEGNTLSDEVFKELIRNSLDNQKYKPLINEIKSLMTNRNIIFMNAFYKKIKNFPSTINSNNIDEYIDKKCKKIQDRFSNGESLQILASLQNR